MTFYYEKLYIYKFQKNGQARNWIFLELLGERNSIREQRPVIVMK